MLFLFLRARYLSRAVPFVEAGAVDERMQPAMSNYDPHRKRAGTGIAIYLVRTITDDKNNLSTTFITIIKSISHQGQNTIFNPDPCAYRLLMQ
jgi:hypothetical protein